MLCQYRILKNLQKREIPTSNTEFQKVPQFTALHGTSRGCKAVQKMVCERNKIPQKHQSQTKHLFFVTTIRQYYPTFMDFDVWSCLTETKPMRLTHENANNLQCLTSWWDSWSFSKGGMFSDFSRNIPSSVNCFIWKAKKLRYQNAWWKKFTLTFFGTNLEDDFSFLRISVTGLGIIKISSFSSSCDFGFSASSKDNNFFSSVSS